MNQADYTEKQLRVEATMADVAKSKSFEREKQVKPLQKKLCPPQSHRSKHDMKPLACSDSTCLQPV